MFDSFFDTAKKIYNWSGDTYNLISNGISNIWDKTNNFISNFDNGLLRYSGIKQDTNKVFYDIGDKTGIDKLILNSEDGKRFGDFYRKHRLAKSTDINDNLQIYKDYANTLKGKQKEEWLKRINEAYDEKGNIIKQDSSFMDTVGKLLQYGNQGIQAWNSIEQLRRNRENMDMTRDMFKLNKQQLEQDIEHRKELIENWREENARNKRIRNNTSKVFSSQSRII